MQNLLNNPIAVNNISIKTSLSFLTPTILEIIDRLCKLTHLPMNKRGELTLIISEVLSNAIKHGNKNVFEKNIHLEYSLMDKTLFISVEDEGEGFLYSNIDEHLGLSLIALLSKEVSWNKKGNKIFITYDINACLLN